MKTASIRISVGNCGFPLDFEVNSRKAVSEFLTQNLWLKTCGPKPGNQILTVNLPLPDNFPPPNWPSDFPWKMNSIYTVLRGVCPARFSAERPKSSDCFVTTKQWSWCITTSMGYQPSAWKTFICVVDVKHASGCTPQTSSMHPLLPQVWLQYEVSLLWFWPIEFVAQQLAPTKCVKLRASHPFTIHPTLTV